MCYIHANYLNIIIFDKKNILDTHQINTQAHEEQNKTGMVHLLWGNVREAGSEGSFLDALFF
jgi:hypothetical protein